MPDAQALIILKFFKKSIDSNGLAVTLISIMAFEIREIEGATPNATPERVAEEIRNHLNISRFTADVVVHKRKVTIHKIRLRESKDYCGNHPYACPVRPNVVEKKHIHSRCLEGADWVGFNDMLNDVLDALCVSAYVASSLCIIRKGSFRRVEYSGHKLGNGIDSEWNKDSHAYECHLGEMNVPRSEYPTDTPGIAEWKA